jgi:hypothetical protein
MASNPECNFRIAEHSSFGRNPVTCRMPAMAFRRLVVVASILFAALPGLSQPSIDYHQHLLSPSAVKLGSLPKPLTARDLIPLLDAAGVRRALVLSLLISTAIQIGLRSQTNTLRYDERTTGPHIRLRSIPIGSGPFAVSIRLSLMPLPRFNVARKTRTFITVLSWILGTPMWTWTIRATSLNCAASFGLPMNMEWQS